MVLRQLQVVLATLPMVLGQLQVGQKSSNSLHFLPLTPQLMSAALNALKMTETN
jgi:hypothetical protein